MLPRHFLPEHKITFTATNSSGNSAQRTLTVNVDLRFSVLNSAVVVTQFRPPRSDIFGAEITFKLGSGNDGVNCLADEFNFVATSGGVVLSDEVPLNAFRFTAKRWTSVQRHGERFANGYRTSTAG